MNKLALVALLGTLSWNAIALDIDEGRMYAAVPGYEQCMDRAESTADMVNCQNMANDAFDKLLNAKYKQVQDKCKSFGHSAKACREKVKIMQRAWLKYRSSVLEQDSAVFYGGGTMAILASISKSNSLLLRQIQLLDSMLNGSDQL